jgi:pyruvate/2-oxoglutarate dehydrogenase complex dihydrolipoamide acyltransferase (E2) component
MGNFKKVPYRQNSPFRMLAANTWRPPNDSQIFSVAELDMSKVLAFIEKFQKDEGVKATPTHIIIKTVGILLARHPKINAKCEGGNIYERDNVSVSVLVDIGGARDLGHVLLRQVEKMSLKEIVDKTTRVAGELKSGQDKEFGRSRVIFNRLPPFLLRRYFDIGNILINKLNLNLKAFGMPRDPFGSALVTSLGMLGIEECFAPIPPLTRISVALLVTAVKDRPWVEDGKVVVRPTMKLCVTLDHRVVDGYESAVVANELREIIANPEKYFK